MFFLPIKPTIYVFLFVQAQHLPQTIQINVCQHVPTYPTILSLTIFQEFVFFNAPQDHMATLQRLTVC